MEPDPTPPAPAVVAVVVTCDPGPWFEQALASLRAQEYPNLSVLVVDSASLVDPTGLVAEALPGAYIKRLERRVGFGRAANLVLELVEGASHYLFCHDDVVLAPDAVRLLVEEAYRSNSGITSPKYLQWDHPDRLLAVGATTDKVGVVSGLVEPGELDQEQHDVVRDILVAPTGVTLVRADLFAALGGFDEAIDQWGEDLDLSWRARIAGARVTVVPGARVRHLEATRTGERAGSSSALARHKASGLGEAHRFRTLLTCYRWFDVAWILPLAWLWVAGEAVTRLVQGRPGEAWHTLGSAGAGMRQPLRLWRARRRVQRHRRAGDAALRHLQSRGNARLRAFLRARMEGVMGGLLPAGSPSSGPEERGPAERGPAAPGRIGRAGLPESTEANRSPWRLPLAVGAVLLIILVIGSRSLFGHALPSVAQIPDTSAGWSNLWHSWWSTWQESGLGVAAPSSPALALLGLLDTALFGAAGTLQHVVVLGPLVLGPLGAYRAARWWGSRVGRIAALIAYAAVPLPYNAVARGHWGGLLAYAAAPWVLGMVSRLSAEAPYPTSRVTWIGGRVAGLGLLVAMVATVAPSFLYVVPLVGVALLAGSALAGRLASGVRMLAVALVASIAAVVLLLPWSATVLFNRPALLGPTVGPSGRLGFGDVLRFQTGPFGHGPLGWGLLVAAALPLFIGRGWRLAWAARLWVVALVSFGVTWAGWRGWVPAVPVEVALAPAAAALAGSAALGAVAFELDLPGYRFGWRQAAAGLAGIALGLASIPLLIASGGGRWDLPSADASSVLAFLPGIQSGDYRVLWVGAPDALPLAGRPLHQGVVYGTSFDGEPTLSDLWLPGPSGAGPQLADDMKLVENGLTTKLGHLLAPTGVRYLVIPNHNGPQGSGAVATAVPSALLSGLELQTDLQAYNAGDPNYTIYVNSAWAPARAVLPAAAAPVARADAATSRRLLQELDLTAATPVVPGPSGVPPLAPAGSTVYVASTRDPSWRVRSAGTSVKPDPAFGWAMSFTLPSASGEVPVHFAPPVSGTDHAIQVGEIVVWAAVVGFCLVDVRRRRNAGSAIETVRPEWFAPLSVRSRPSGRRRPGPAPLGAGDLEGDEVWVDV